MRHTPLHITALAATLLGVTLAGNAQTERPGAAVDTGSSAPDRGTMGGAGNAQAFMGAHQLSGTVTQVDKTEGSLSLRSDSGDTLNLHFPPPVVADLATGDRVTVQLALRADTGRMNDANGGPKNGGATETR